MSNSFKLCPAHFHKGEKTILGGRTPASFGPVSATLTSVCIFRMRSNFQFGLPLWANYKTDRCLLHWGYVRL